VHTIYPRAIGLAGRTIETRTMDRRNHDCIILLSTFVLFVIYSRLTRDCRNVAHGLQRHLATSLCFFPVYHLPFIALCGVGCFFVPNTILEGDDRQVVDREEAQRHG